MPLRAACLSVVVGIGLVPIAGRSSAHFLILLPATDIVDDQDSRTVTLDLRFTHPMEQGPLMELARPRQVAALAGGKQIDLAPGLQIRKLNGKSTYTCSLETKLPGDYVVYVEPEPYWEAAEEKMKSPVGTMVEVELGGLMWVKAVDMPTE